MPQLPEGQLTPSDNMYPCYEKALQTERKNHIRVPTEKVWYNVWAPHRLANIRKRHQRDGTLPGSPHLMRIMGDYYVSSDGNHRCAYFEEIGLENYLARVFVVEYKDMLKRTVLRKLREKHEMWIYRHISDSYRGADCTDVHWVRQAIRRDQYDFLVARAPRSHAHDMVTKDLEAQGRDKFKVVNVWTSCYTRAISGLDVVNWRFDK